MANEVNNTPLHDLLKYCNLEEYLSDIKQYNETLFDRVGVDVRLIQIIENVRHTIEGLLLLVNTDTLIDDNTKLDLLKQLIDVHQAMINYVSQTKDIQTKDMYQLNAILNGMHKLYAIFLFGISQTL